MKKKGLLVCLILAALIGVLTFRKPADENKASAVDVERYVSAEGKVEIRPGFEVEIGSELEGRIAEFPVKEGDCGEQGRRDRCYGKQGYLREARGGGGRPCG